ncbi:hypothetical protein BX616_006459 [Lobosporangium transversale]|nr:hypothetical protein BX616_006459 [Lobosporangium transversale]
MRPEDDRSLPIIANMGLTNLVDRPSRMGNELSETECRAAAPTLTAKIKKYRPRFVCFISKQAWDMYAGVGLGLQTAWVSWYDEPEDQMLLGMDHGHNHGNSNGSRRSHSVQDNLDSQGYRLAPFFERGPSLDKIKRELEAQGVPFQLKRELSETKDDGIKSEPSEDKKTNELMHVKKEPRDEDKIKTEIKEEPELSTMKMEIDTKDGSEHVELKADHAHVRSEGKGKGKGKSKSESESREEMGRSRLDASGSLDSRSTMNRGAVRGSRMFVIPSTSGRVTHYKKEDKLAYFKQLAELVRQDRRMRGVKDPWDK